MGDLEEVANYPELLSSGPAAVLLGQTPAAQAPLPEPHPTIALSSLSQDRAIHSAMVNELTVVTGPPGTGKSQVLVNVVAAAVARGETVLFASKNNQAVNVVVDRLRSSSSNAIVIRAGSAAERGKMAESIKGVLSSRPRDVDSVGAFAMHGRQSRDPFMSCSGLWVSDTPCETELGACESALTAMLDRLPPDVSGDLDLQQLDTALADTCRALESFGDRLWWFGRKRRHRRRLAHAREALHRISDILGKRREEVEACLSEVDERPVRTLAPRRAFRSIEESRERSAGQCSILAKEGTRFEPDSRSCHANSNSKTGCSNSARRVLRQAADCSMPAGTRCATRARKPARRPCSCPVPSNAWQRNPGMGKMKPFRLFPRPCPPCRYGRSPTCLHARTCPSSPASSISSSSTKHPSATSPRRFHSWFGASVPSLSETRSSSSTSPPSAEDASECIARQSGLTDAQTIEFSYTDKSCFALASSRVPLDPLMLDLHFRSHPAIIDFSNRRFYDDALKLCCDYHGSGRHAGRPVDPALSVPEQERSTTVEAA